MLTKIISNQKKDEEAPHLWVKIFCDMRDNRVSSLFFHNSFGDNLQLSKIPQQVLIL